MTSSLRETKRSSLQKLRDRQRCELGHSDPEKCKCPCQGKYHGVGRNGNHDISDIEADLTNDNLRTVICERHNGRMGRLS